MVYCDIGEVGVRSGRGRGGEGWRDLYRVGWGRFDAERTRWRGLQS